MDLQQGRVDPTLEENCVRERLYIKNDGLTQDCQTFGQYTKPLRSKHFIKERNTDCDKIEKLKQLGKWPPKNVRNLSTYISSTFDFQRRNFCSSAHVLIMNKDENLKETDPENENEIQKLKSERARSFHALCKKPQIILTEEADKEVCQNQLMEIDEFCKNVKFRNVQWRMDNFQKWYRLKKKNKLSHVIKKYHTCSKLKYRSFVRSTQNSQCLSTTTVKTRVRNSNVRGVICSKLKFRRLQRNKLAPKHLSISTVRTPVDDSSTQKGISTAKSRAINKKQKIIRFPLYPKPIKKTPSIKIPNLPEQMKRVELTSERDEKDNGQPLRLNDCRSMRTWQPKYPGVPEVDTPTIPRHKPKNDPSWEKECLIHFTEKEKGKSWDCSALEKPFIRLNTSSMEARALASKEDTANCFPCGEVFIRSNKVQRKTKSPPGRRLRATKCHKSSNLCPPVSKHQFKLPCPALPKLNFDIPPKILQSPVVLGLWQKVVNYFKAKPNCPSPDEWKKRALREKAERAAKAAGLCLIDPEDLQKTLSKKSNRRGAIDSNQGCFPTRKNPCKTTTRNYSSGVDWGNTEELNKLLEEEKKKQLAKKLSRILKDESNLDDDVNLKCPDPLFESILKEVILKRNSLSCLEKLADREVEDECFGYCLKIVPSNINAFDECVRESSTEESKFDQSEQISDYQKYFSKIDSLSEITYEELGKYIKDETDKNIRCNLTENK